MQVLILMFNVGSSFSNLLFLLLIITLKWYFTENKQKRKQVLIVAQLKATELNALFYFDVIRTVVYHVCNVDNNNVGCNGNGILEAHVSEEMRNHWL